MRSSRVARVALLLMLAGAGAQATAGTAFLASALTLGLHAHGHAHAVSIVREEGHLHLILGHVEGSGHGRETVPHHEDLPGSLSESEHVFHVTGDGASASMTRRAALSPAAALAGPMVRQLSPARSVFRPAPEPRARGTDLLRPVVLRL
jgi:hypothetical protein